MDTNLLWFYVRMWDLRVSDLMEVPVYGLVREENQGHENLFPFFNYDELFGTVLNQFVETFFVNDLVARVQQAGKRLNLDVTVKSLPNPRKEAEDHYYNPVHTGLLVWD